MSLKNLLKSPQASNDFSVVVSDSDWSKQWIDIISTQTQALDVNLVWKRVTLYVRQLRSGYIQDLIFHILNDDYRKIDQIRISPARNAVYEYVFTDGHLVDHEVNFDYYNKNPLIHTLVLEFKAVTLHSNAAHAPESKIKIEE